MTVTIIHFITSLSIGGAEISLLKFLEHSDRTKYKHIVYSLTKPGKFGVKISQAGIPVNVVFERGIKKTLSNFKEIIINIRSYENALVHCWMYHANLVGGFFALFARKPCIWGIRHNEIKIRALKVRTIFIILLGGILSHFIPDLIIFNSRSSLSNHKKYGYKESISMAVPNGFDVAYFKPDHKSGIKFRKTINVPENNLLVGFAGRNDPSKDHLGFLKAALIVLQKYSTCNFILCGRGIDKNNKPLSEFCIKKSISHKILLMGELDDMHSFYCGLDIFVLSSITESFPNVVGEAMSCAVPCVVTNVGECKDIVGNSGIIVPPGNSIALANGIIKLINDIELRKRMGQESRKRICKHYGISFMAKSFEKYYSTIVKDAARERQK